jgi:pyridoxine 4-dehydrogenase
MAHTHKLQTGDFKKPDDIPEGDFRRHFPRFQGEAFFENIKLVAEVEKLAKRKGATPGQIGIAWIQALSGSDGMPIIIPIPGASTDKRVKENSAANDVKLTSEDMEELEGILKAFVPSGGRYPENHGAYLLNG